MRTDSGYLQGLLSQNVMLSQMNKCGLKILFMHGLDSSRETYKFHVLNSENKWCITIDYRNLNFQTVEHFYQEIIDKIQPQILVGHSLGGYWALKMSTRFKLPALLANPSLSPRFRSDYPPINDTDLDSEVAKLAYLELGDEQLNMSQVQERLEPFMWVEAVEGGCHRLANPDNLNQLLYHLEHHLL